MADGFAFDVDTAQRARSHRAERRQHLGIGMLGLGGAAQTLPRRFVRRTALRLARLVPALAYGEAEFFASDDAAGRFVERFAAAFAKVMELGRF